MASLVHSTNQQPPPVIQWPIAPPQWPSLLDGQPYTMIYSSLSNQAQQQQLFNSGPSNCQAQQHQAQPVYGTATSPKHINNTLGPYSLNQAHEAHLVDDTTSAIIHPPWFMDTGATDHIATQSGILKSIFNSSITPSIRVGNGSLAPVTSVGNSSIIANYRPLHLKNVLVCPSIIKNLVSVRGFVTDNHCSVEFDPFGFSVKDLTTWIMLLRCDSSGPLYSVTSPSSSPPLVLTADSHLWHRRLGHPGTSVSQSPKNKADLTALCHACKLGKNIRLPFASSSTIVTEPFQNIHSDISTKPSSEPYGEDS